MTDESIYEKAPWLKLYPSDVPPAIEIPVKSIGDAFDETVQKRKKRNAIIYYGRKISYQKLGDMVDRFATALSALGIKKGDRVALLLLNSPEFFTAFFGVVKLGAVIVPISPVYVSSEIKHQLTDSGAETIICQDFLYDVVEKTGVKLKNVILTNIGESLPRFKKFMGKSILREVYQKMALPDSDVYLKEGFHQLKELVAQHQPNPPEVDINPKEDILSLPYTGGTTGPPKGVMLTHYNAMAGAIQFAAFYPSLCEEGRETFVSYMPFYHQAGQALLMLRGIIYGGTQVVLTNPDLDDIINSVVQYRATFFLGAPSIYEALKDYKKTGRIDWKKFKAVASGADQLHEFTQEDWQARTGVPLHDMWGMTECSDIVIGTPLGKVKIGSVGIPLPNVMAAILDPDKDEFFPAGELGELAIISPTITEKGYWQKPDATKECESVINGGKWWRTGDLAKMDEDGYFFIYDRKRDLIKYKGLRVFAREVEEVLKLNPNIKEIGVVGVKDQKVGEVVKAVIVLESDARGKISEADITEYCKDKLASYKIPRIVEFVGEIPKTDVGKVSRREIREEEL